MFVTLTFRPPRWQNETSHPYSITGKYRGRSIAFDFGPSGALGRICIWFFPNTQLQLFLPLEGVIVQLKTKCGAFDRQAWLTLAFSLATSAMYLLAWFKSRKPKSLTGTNLAIPEMFWISNEATFLWPFSLRNLISRLRNLNEETSNVDRFPFLKN